MNTSRKLRCFVGRQQLILLGALVVALSSSACAFSDGDPWGEVQFAVTAGLDASDRGTEDGYQTSNDYLVRIESFEIDFLDVAVAATSAGATAFDPADPPPGYSLCHNGHCHSDDGGLVDYEDISLELAGASADGATTLQAIGAAAELTEAPIALPLDVCSDGCRLERGELGLASLRASGASIRVHITDRRSGDRQRLPDEGATFELDSQELFEWAAPLSEHIDGRADPMIELDLNFRVPVTVFDGINWLEAAGQQEFFTNLRDDALLDADVVRTPY